MICVDNQGTNLYKVFVFRNISGINVGSRLYLVAIAGTAVGLSCIVISFCKMKNVVFY